MLMKKIIILLLVTVGIQSFAAYEESDYDPYYKKDEGNPLKLYSSSFGNQPSNIGVGLNLGTTRAVNVVYQNLVINVGLESLPVVGTSSQSNTIAIDTSVDLIFRATSTDNLAIPLYYGAGIKLQNETNKNIGLRGVIGVGAFLTDVDENFEVFAEFTPTLYLPFNATSPLSFEFGMGARYYF
jgi:hypothetical protein